jgi:DNA-binding transcriptional regulator YhcF (GntR family)
MNIEIDLNSDSVIPLYVQLKSRLEYMIGTGTIPSGTRVPSVRELATQLGVAPSTVQQAYRELQQKGLLETQRGRGTFVPQIPSSTLLNNERSALVRQRVDELIAFSQEQGVSPDELRSMFEDRIAVRERGLRIGFVGIRDAMEKYATLIQESLANRRVSVAPLSLERLRADPAGASRLLTGYDLLVTLLFHYREVAELGAGSGSRVMPIITELGDECLERIALLPTDARIGLVCHRTSLDNYLASIRLYRPAEQIILHGDPEQEDSMERLLEGATVILHTTVLTSLVHDYFPPDLPVIELKHVPKSDSLERVREQVERMQL